MDDQVLEAIAERIHEAWAAEKQRQGFADHVWKGNWVGNTGYVQCTELSSVDPLDGTEARCPIPWEQHHTDMLPYTQLPENVKEYDRVTARAALQGIEKAGYKLVKGETPA